MRNISLSTRLLIALAALAVALVATLAILTPPEKWAELKTLHSRACAGAWYSAEAGNAGGPDNASGPGTYVGPEYRFRRPHGHPPVFGFVLVILLILFVGGRFGFPRRREDASISILEELFAEGKIDEAEFARRRSVLSGSSGKEE